MSFDDESPMSTPSAHAITSRELVPLPRNNSAMVVLGARKLQTPKETRTVLKEEKYLDQLETIIQRDYYPDVPKLRAQLEYANAVDVNDVAKIRELQLRYSTMKRTDRRTSPTMRRGSPELFDPDQTPAGAHDDPDANKEGDNDAVIRESKSDTAGSSNLNIDKFLSKYTSEDNASFEELTALNAKRERIRLAWMYKAEEEHNRLRVTQSEALRPADEQLALPSTQPRPCDLDNWTYKARNSVLFDPTDAVLTVEEHIQRQKMNQRVINRDATRFTQNPFQESLKQTTMNKAALLHAASMKGNIDVSGEVAGFRHPGQLFSFVATPSPAPGVDESPMMTWGEIEGTPFRLDASDMPTGIGGPTFKMPEIPLRDKLAQEITDNIGKRYRDKRRKAVKQAEMIHTKTPRFGSIRSSGKQLLDMSPAARRLATNKLGIRLGSDKALRASYTPSPSPTIRTPNRTPKSTTATPDRNSVRASRPSSSSITDNLLDLKNKTRPSAVDFF